MNKKAMSEIGSIIWKQWGEVFFIVLLILGFLVAISIRSAFLVYLVIFCAGLFSGRTVYKKKGRQPLFPFFLIIVGFLLGYIFGSFAFEKVSQTLIVILFVLGGITGYYLHKKGYVH